MKKFISWHLGKPAKSKQDNYIYFSTFPLDLLCASVKNHFHKISEYEINLLLVQFKDKEVLLGICENLTISKTFSNL